MRNQRGVLIMGGLFLLLLACSEHKEAVAPTDDNKRSDELLVPNSFFSPAYPADATVHVTTNEYSSQVSAAVSAWNSAWDASASEANFSMTTGDYTLAVTFSGTGQYFCGQGSGGGVSIDKHESSSYVCPGGRTAEPLSSLTALLMHEIGHAIGYSGLDSFSATSSCVMNVPASGNPLNSEICVHEQQLAFWGYDDRDSVDLAVPMIESVSVQALSMDPSDTVWVRPSYSVGSVTPVDAPSWSIEDSTTVARIVARNGDSVRVAALATGNTTIHVSIGSDPHVIWPAPGSAQAAVTVSGPQAPTPCFTVESSSTWQMTEQYFDASCSEGTSLRYQWRFEAGGSWTDTINSPLMDFSGHSTTGSKTVTLKVIDTSTGRDSTTSQTITVSSGTVTVSGETDVSLKTKYPYLSTAAGTWWERYPPETDWSETYSEYVDSIGRIWPAGEYYVDLRAEDGRNGVLRRGVLPIYVSSELRSSPASKASSNIGALFGGGPIVTWGESAEPHALHFYNLMGAHDVSSVFQTPAWLDLNDGGAEGRNAVAVSWKRISNAGFVSYEFSIEAATAAEYVFGFSLDPDLGFRAGDDVSGFDPQSRMVYASDRTGAVGFMLRSSGKDALKTVTQFGTHRFAPTNQKVAWTVQRQSGADLLTGPSDVQFMIAAPPTRGSAKYQLIVLSAASAGELIKKARVIS